MSRRRVFIIGFHGGGRYFVEPLVQQGRMPNWSRLASAGTSGYLTAPRPVSACSWVTLLTGLDVDQHGVVDTCRVDAGEFPGVFAEPSSSSTYRHETVFDLASRAGLRVGGVAVPMTSPPWPVNGVLIPGVPVREEASPPTWPPELRDEVSPISICHAEEVDRSDIAGCRRYLDFDLARVNEVSRRLYEQQRYDLFVAVFKVPDISNHLFYANPALDDWRSVIEEYHERTDAAVGEVLRWVDPESAVIIVSDHGNGPMPSLLFRVSTWLEEQGLLARHHAAAVGPGALQVLHHAYRAVRGSAAAAWLKRSLPVRWLDAGRALGHHWPFVDLSRTRVYPVDHFFPMAGFEVNLRGRQAAGIVAPEDFERTRDEIIDALARTRIPGTDRPLCRSIQRREEMFTGAHADKLADVIVELDPDVEADLRFGTAVFEPNAGKPTFPYSGYHAPDALFLASGPGIRHGEIVDGAVRDVMPTVMQLLDLPVANDRRGRVLPVERP
jgi:predicted AlkP superfamily phosphohydrolase/phosphomutase